MRKMNVKVVYNVPEGIDEEFEKYLKIMFSYIGFHCWASGTDLRTKDRDLAFTNKEEEDGTF